MHARTSYSPSRLAALARRTLLAALLLAAAACSTDGALAPADIRPLHYSTGHNTLTRVDGLRAALAGSPDQPVRVLALHGMIAHAPRYSEEMQRAIAQRLGLRMASDSSQPVQRGYTFVPAYGAQPFDGVTGPPLPAQLRRTGWVDAGAPAGAPERLVFHELLWAPLRDQFKNRFIACFESATLRAQADCGQPGSGSLPNPDPRALVNRLLKDNFTLAGFADATLVLGPIGDVLRDDVTLALCLLAADVLQAQAGMQRLAPGERCNLAAVAQTKAAQDQAALALQATKMLGITHSLGSFLLLDAQQRYAQTRAEPASQGGSDADLVQEQLLFWLFDRATVFMNANQFSLLSLARLSPAACQAHNGQAACPNRLLRRPDPWNGPQPMAQLSTWVAFNDTDDLLGFELPPFLADTDGHRYVNVSVRNPGWRLPGLVKDPAAAHTAQAKNPAIVRAIVEGIELPAP